MAETIERHDLPEPVRLEKGRTYICGLRDGKPYIREATEEDIAAFKPQGPHRVMHPAGYPEVGVLEPFTDMTVTQLLRGGIYGEQWEAGPCLTA